MAQRRTRRPAPEAGAGQNGDAAHRRSDDPEALRQAAAASLTQNAEALRKVALPLAAEPAFVFRP